MLTEGLEKKIDLAIKLYRRKIRSDVFRNITVVAIAATATTLALHKQGIINPQLPEDRIALIEYHGVVSDSNDATNALKVTNLLSKLAEDSNTKAILFDLNSGGGSPVQAEALYKAIQSLKDDEEPIKFYGSIGEICASACVYVASALDEVYAHETSIVGSVGVRMDSWGLDKVIDKYGVERRTLTVGDNKAIFDPFSPRNEDIEKHLKNELLQPVYESFVTSVKEGRGDRISDNEELYSGLVWGGVKAAELGFTDGVLTSWEVREMLKGKYEVDQVAPYQTTKKGIKVHIETALTNVVDNWLENKANSGSIKF
ncbi:putative S49 family peptidase [Vibrio chagasii]|nr:putative S49 family peptidase [Vibrio chagasii]